MKSKLLTLGAFVLTAFTAASILAVIDVLYCVSAGVYITSGFQNAVVAFAESVIVNSAIILAVAVLFWLLSLSYSALRRKAFTFNERRWAFVFCPSIAILAFILVACPVNIKMKNEFFIFERMLVNVLLLTFTGTLAVLSVFAGRRLILISRTKLIRIVSYTISILSFVVVIWWLFLYSKPTNVRPGPPIDGPNVIIITIDALRQDRVGAYGAGYVETPNLDRFASRAVRFERTRFPGSWTVPSMYSMLSSRYPSAHGAGMRKAANADIVMLAEVLKSRGYRTEAYVANLVLYSGIGFNRGFDRYIGYHDLAPIIAFEETTIYRFVNRFIRVIRNQILSPIVGVKQTDSTKWLTDVIIASLERNKDRPFFLWAHYMDPHTPLHPPRRYVEWEDENQIDDVIAFGKLKIDDYDQEEKDRDKLVALYEAEVRYVDDMVGRILDVIERDGFYNDSIIIVTADHGEEFFEHGGYGHARTHYDEVASLPLFIYVPGVEPGVSYHPASLNDLMPTILDYVGVDPPVGISGESLRTVLDGDRDPGGVKLLFTDQLGEKDPSMKSVCLYPYTIIRTGYDTYSYEMVDNRIHKGPDDIVPDPEPDIYGLMLDTLDEFALDMEDEARAFGSSVELQFDEDRLNKLKELGYVD